MTSQAEDKGVVTTILLSPKQHEAFKRVAAASHRTMSGQARVWIEEADEALDEVPGLSSKPEPESEAA